MAMSSDQADRHYQLQRGIHDRQTLDHDRNLLFQHAALKGAQSGSMASVILVPGYLRSSFTLKKFFRGTALVTLTGSLLAGGVAFQRMRGLNQNEVHDRVHRLSENAGQKQVDSFSIIGSSLTAVSSAALFLRSAGLVTSLVGGGALGLGLGSFYHIGLMFQKGEEPQEMVKTGVESVENVVAK